MLDIAIMGGLIVEVAKDLSAEANITIDATHKMVTPRFIDVHSHCDLVPFMSGSICESRIRQGVTTEFVGQCGLGSAPNTDKIPDWRNYLTSILGTGPQHWDWSDYATFVRDLGQTPKPNNISFLIGHGAVRAHDIRSHSLQIREAMTEALAVAKESGVKLQISHMRSYANRHYGITGQGRRRLGNC